MFTFQLSVFDEINIYIVRILPSKLSFRRVHFIIITNGKCTD